MAKYKFMVLIFLFILMGTAFASMLGVNVQSVYRVPGIYIKWIDVGILTIICIYFIQLQFNEERLTNNDFIILLCYLYLLFAFFQLGKSWKENDGTMQLQNAFSKQLKLNFFTQRNFMTNITQIYHGLNEEKPDIIENDISDFLILFILKDLKK